MRIAVIDGQGGGIGKAIVEKLRKSFGEEIEILALGTNALATALMLKAGANEGASGENAIAQNAAKVDVIAGTVAIIVPNSMLGEMTPRAANAVAESPAKKLLIPLNRCNIFMAGMQNEPLPHYIEDLASMLEQMIRSDRNV